MRLLQGKTNAEAKHLLQHKLTSASSQVDFMTSQMTEMQREVDDKLKIEAALKKAEQARKEVCCALSQLAFMRMSRVLPERHDPLSSITEFSTCPHGMKCLIMILASCLLCHKL